MALSSTQNTASSKTNTSMNIEKEFARLGLHSAPTKPLISNNLDTKFGRTLFTAEWGVDKNQDVARGGTITHGPFANSDWMCVADGHGVRHTVPIWLREIPDKMFETWMSTNNPGAELEKELARKQIHGCHKSGACMVLARITPFGEVEIWNAGDSRAMVLARLKDGTVTTLLETRDQTADNANELMRLLEEKHPFEFTKIQAQARHPTLEELHKIGIQCNLLCVDSKMLKVLPQKPGSSLPCATMTSGLRVNFSNTEVEYQMSRSIGHAPNGVTGTNWDYYRVRVPLHAKIHVLCSSDGLWDVCPSIETLFDWCESGGVNLMNQIAARWVGNWDYQHEWSHGCDKCIRRRIKFLEQQIQSSSKGEKYNLNIELLKELKYLIRRNPELGHSLKSQINAITKEIDALKYEYHSIECANKTFLPDTPYNGEPIYSIQPGMKPDDMSVALCSWEAKGHITFLKGLVSKMDTTEVIDFALSHTLLGEHCVALHFDGDGHNENGLQEIIAKLIESGNAPFIQAALRKRPDDEIKMLNESSLDNESEFMNSWKLRLNCENLPIHICSLEGPSCGEDYDARYALHGQNHLMLEIRMNDKDQQLPIAVMCCGSGNVTTMEQANAPDYIPFFMINIDRPNKAKDGRELPKIPRPMSYPEPESVDWSPDPSGTPLLPSPQMWMVMGRSSVQYAPHFPMDGVKPTPESSSEECDNDELERNMKLLKELKCRC